MNCEEARQSLDAYVDEELDLTRQLAMERHIAECAACRVAAEYITSCSFLVRTNMPVYKAPP